MDPVPCENVIYEEVKVKPTIPFDMDENKCYGQVSIAASKIENGGRKCKKRQLFIILILFALLFAIAGACVAFSLEINKLKSDITSLNGQIVYSLQQLHSKIDRSYQQLNESTYSTHEQFNKIAALQLNTSIDHDMLYQQLSQQNASIYSAYQQLRQEYTALDNRTQQLNTSTQLSISGLESYTMKYLVYPSCAALPPSSPSGYYWVRASDGSAVSVYCDITLLCGGVTGGWMRVAGLDMTNSTHQCPSGLRQRIDSGKRTCRIDSTSVDICSSVVFPINDLRYSQVCGKIIAYQFASPDAFGRRGDAITIDENYMDGVSLTHGNPRHHIWTFAAATDELGSACPCISSNSNGFSTPPAFVGEDYFCDTGSTDHWDYIFYVNDPLWDGAGCGPQNTCCSFNNPPWFYKQLPQHTTDDIEMRVCRDQVSGDEDVAIETIDIYIQ